MKVLIAPNALKGSLSAVEAAEIMAQSVPSTWDAVLCPIADGGDGTLDCLVNATRGKLFKAMVTGPLPFQRVSARWGELGNQRSAVIEMAEASGLQLLTASQYSASNSTTFGVGELILKVLDAGFRKIYVGLGGSATNDGGAGCVQALGVRLLDRNAGEIPMGGIQLKQLHKIDISHCDKRIDECEFICLADVQSVLAGPLGATSLYGAQKGASPGEMKLLDEALSHFGDVLFQKLHVDVATLPGGGAAGGLGAGLSAFCNATIVSGIEHILDLVGFDDLIRDCDIILTAEGSIDEQTIFGKGISGIAQRAKKYDRPVYVFAGRIRGDEKILLRQLGIHTIRRIAPPDIGETESISRVKELLGQNVREFAKNLK